MNDNTAATISTIPKASETDTNLIKSMDNSGPFFLARTIETSITCGAHTFA